MSRRNPGADERRRIAGIRSDVAGDHDHDRHLACRELPHLGVGARSGRIEHDGVVAIEFEGEQRTAEQIALLVRDLAQVWGLACGAVKRRKRRGIGFDRVDIGPLGQPQGERAAPREQIGDAAGAPAARDDAGGERRLPRPRSPAETRRAAASRYHASCTTVG